jgi:NADPH2:quinone reductase
VKAVGVYEFGGPEALQVLDLPEPQAGPGEVGIRIRIHAAAVSPTDVLLRTGGHAFRMPDRQPRLSPVWTPQV